MRILTTAFPRSALLVALTLLAALLFSCAERSQEDTKQAAEPVSYAMLTGFPDKDETKPEPPGKGLDATACLDAASQGGKQLDELQDQLHRRAVDVMICKTLDDPYLSKELFAKGDALPDDLRTQAANCLRITDERYYNGQKLGELCVRTSGALIEDGCERLHRVMATHSACASQKGTALKDLETLALQKALRDILAKEHPDLAKAPLEDLKRLLSKLTIVTSRQDQPSNTACVQVAAVYTPMAAAFYKSALASEAEAKELARKKRLEAAGARTFFLDLGGYDVGDLLPVYGENIAVVQDINGTKALGLNGVTEGQAVIADLVPDDLPKDGGGSPASGLSSGDGGKQTADSKASKPTAQDAGKTAANTTANTTADTASHDAGKDAGSTDTGAGKPAAEPSSAAQPTAAPQPKSPAKGKMVHKDLPQTVPLAGQRIDAFTMTVRISHDLPPLAKPDPKDFSGGVEPLTQGDEQLLMEMLYSEFIREQVAVTLSRKEDGSYQAVFRLGQVSTNPVPFEKPTHIHEYVYEHSGGQTKLHVDGVLVKSAPSPGKGLVSVSYPFFGATRLYEMQVKQDLTATQPVQPAPAGKGTKGGKAEPAAKGAPDSGSGSGGGSGGGSGASPDQTGKDIEEAIDTPTSPPTPSGDDQNSDPLDMLNPLDSVERRPSEGQCDRKPC